MPSAIEQDMRLDYVRQRDRSSQRWASIFLIFTVALLGLVPRASANMGTGTVISPLAHNFVGCYQLKKGRWWPWGFGSDNRFVSVSDRVELLLDRGTVGFEKDEPHSCLSSTGERPGETTIVVLGNQIAYSRLPDLDKRAYRRAYQLEPKWEQI